MSSTNLLTPILFVVILASTKFAVAAEESIEAIPATIPNSFRHMLYSEEIGQTFQIDIAMPYQFPVEVADTYPVIYVVDGNGLFPLVYTNARTLAGGLELAPAIVVGIGYDTDESLEIFSLRTRDMTPTKDEDLDRQMNNNSVSLPIAIDSGHAGSFIEFIEKEVKPFVNSNYPTDTSNEVFAGYSFGGLFGLYVLFNHAETFDKYVLGSPSITWDESVSFSYEESYADTHDDLAKSVFISTGTLESETMTNDAQTMYENILSRGYENLDIEYLEFEGETHASGTGVALNRGLKSVLAKDTETFRELFFKKMTEAANGSN